MEIDLKTMHEIEIEMLEYFNNICISNNIKYSLIGGGLIGTFRHNGFVPWDDDVDIVMRREDYDKLLLYIKQHNDNDKYEFLLPNQPNDYLYPFCKLVDKRTKMIEDNISSSEKLGVFQDIFVYDNIPNNKFSSKFYISKKKNYLKLIFHNMKKKNTAKGIKKLGIYFLKLLLLFISQEKLYVKYDKYCKKYNSKKCDRMISNWPIYSNEREIQNKTDFENYIFHKFENIEVMVTANYDEILTKVFGDYMKLPPLDKQVTHHYYKVMWRNEDENKE